ncbi:transposase zinc-binding domain-containing protein [Enterocloster citroniae]|uniref:IS91 family transposase n=1 Tax=Enterocloster citroniae TaxID=358743 RepID=UPI003A7F2D17
MPSALSTPLPLTHEGFWGFLFVAFYCIIFLCVIRTSYKLFFLTTLNTSKYVIRPGKNVLDNIDRTIHCHDPSYGGAFFACPHCGILKFGPFSRKSRFCPSCGNTYNQKRAFRMSCKLVSCNHRHCVFTIPEELRSFFLMDHSLLNCLFHSVRNVILRMFFKLNKSEHFTPGFICVLHTFGRDLKWNPHTHALISEGGASNFTSWRPNTHFDYVFLHLAFRKVLFGSTLF